MQICLPFELRRTVKRINASYVACFAEEDCKYYSHFFTFDPLVF